MPVTPFHFGVGVLFKGAAPARTSLLAFVVSQVVIDLEPAYYMFRGEWPFHRALHSFALATPVGMATGLLVWCAGRAVLRLGEGWPMEFGLGPALLGGGLGGATHPLLDALMHHDLRPLMPFSSSNPFLHAVGFWTLHALCVAAAVAGLALWARAGRPGQPPSAPTRS